MEQIKRFDESSMQRARASSHVAISRAIVILSTIGFACAFVAMGGPALAQSTVIDKTGSLPQIAITQIDNRNTALEGKTGAAIAVLVEHGTADESEQDATSTVRNVFGRNFGAVVWIQTGLNKTDIIYLGPTLKWVTPAQQDTLSGQLQNALQACCLSDNLPRVIDALATDMELGSQVPPDPHHYIIDNVGLLDPAHLATITAREQQLESDSGKGVGVIIIQEQPDQSSNDVALRDARSLNVKGDVAAVVWVARSETALTFSVVPMPAYAAIIPQSTAANINANFQADMQSGQIGDAVVAAVDRIAAAVAAGSTPMPAGSAGSAAPAAPAAAPSGNLPTVAVPVTYPKGWSQTSTAVLIILAIAAVITIVTLAIRRNR